MKDALFFIVSSIVDNQDAVSISEEIDENGITNYLIQVAKEDVGKLIGKGGKVIRSLRNVMKIPAIKENKRIRVSISEEE